MTDEHLEILKTMPGDQAVRTHEQWQIIRRNAGKPITLEKLSVE